MLKLWKNENVFEKIPLNVNCVIIYADLGSMGIYLCDLELLMLIHAF